MVGAVTAGVVGSLLALVYGALMPVVTGRLASGAPGLEAELWLANALLAVTFPAMAWATDFFGLWPLGAREPAADDRAAELQPVAVDADAS